ncbi:NAD(P)H nitroreductase [Sphaerisporangium flaviroseum]|uniref:NAD(P)H nitroreductase n=1 Tax=Sphaerisporangium flaviroseum TaxID=509199 RepID=A0ABP7HCF6_9ACTN
MNTRTSDEIARAARTAVEAAVWAPSVHNTQPWSLAVRGDEISLRADPDRKLRLADAAGRQMLISGGAALFDVRIALRELGYEPEVRVLPDPDRPLLLATIRMRAAGQADEHSRLLYGEIKKRRTHRAGFTDAPLPEDLVEALVAQASTEGACLTPVRSEAAMRVLAALTNAAQDVQSDDRGMSLEIIRWSGPPGSVRQDGVPARGHTGEPRRTFPQHFDQRGYAWGNPCGSETDQSTSTSTGLVAVLTTPGDSREDWLAAGQGLQRVLLHASAHGVRAAFHTQALEFPELREFLRQHVCSGAFPQMIMRLGLAQGEVGSVRRPVSDVLEEN